MSKKNTRELNEEEMQLPNFHFGEIKLLYKNDLTIADDLYNVIVEKDRNLLVQDLEKVLQHAIDNYKIFSDKNVANKNTFFVWHTLFLLNDLQAAECLPAVLNFFKQDEDIIGFYLGDGVTEFVWQLFYILTGNDLRVLVDFCKEVKDDYEVRLAIIDTLAQISLYQPQRTLEIESYLRELLLHASTTSQNDDLNIDEVAIKLLDTIRELGFTGLFPEIKMLLDERKLPLFFQLDFKSFKRQYDLEKGEGIQQMELCTRNEIYTQYLEATEKDYDDDDIEDEDWEEYLKTLDEQDAFEDTFEEAEDRNIGDSTSAKSYIPYEENHKPFVKKEPDVGRNDPCPCGSGKKYKKCHGKS